jgi:glycosyltransferase A (GT-A) superfamily protein (DUF2064 family)
VDEPTASIRIGPNGPAAAEEIALAVIAKEPLAGRSKTRLCPPCSAIQAAELAEAALLDTLMTSVRTPAARHVLVLDGEPGPWLEKALSGAESKIDAEWRIDDFEVISQREGGLADRLAGAFADIGQPTLLIGMDTPQVTSAMLRRGLQELARPQHDAVLGLAEDGGYWAIGLSRAEHRVFEGVPMSTDATGAIQSQRLRVLGLRTFELEQLRDVDRFCDAVQVAGLDPSTHFARALAPIALELEQVSA